MTADLERSSTCTTRVARLPCTIPLRRRGGGRPPPPLTAKAKEIAGDKDVGVNGGQMARQCLDAGLLDEVHVDLVPVLLGGGTPFFSALRTSPVQLEGPTSVIEGTGVTHLKYLVRKNATA